MSSRKTLIAQCIEIFYEISSHYSLKSFVSLVRQQICFQRGRIVIDLLNATFPNRYTEQSIGYGHWKSDTRKGLLIKIEQSFDDVRERIKNVDWQEKVDLCSTGACCNISRSSETSILTTFYVNYFRVKSRIFQILFNQIVKIHNATLITHIFTTVENSNHVYKKFFFKFKFIRNHYTKALAFIVNHPLYVHHFQTFFENNEVLFARYYS